MKKVDWREAEAVIAYAEQLASDKHGSGRRDSEDPEIFAATPEELARLAEHLNNALKKAKKGESPPEAPELDTTSEEGWWAVGVEPEDRKGPYNTREIALQTGIREELGAYEDVLDGAYRLDFKVGRYERPIVPVASWAAPRELLRPRWMDGELNEGEVWIGYALASWQAECQEAGTGFRSQRLHPVEAAAEEWAGAVRNEDGEQWNSTDGRLRTSAQHEWGRKRAGWLARWLATAERYEAKRARLVGWSVLLDRGKGESEAVTRDGALVEVVKDEALLEVVGRVTEHYRRMMLDGRNGEVLVREGEKIRSVSLKEAARLVGEERKAPWRLEDEEPSLRAAVEAEPQVARAIGLAHGKMRRSAEAIEQAAGRQGG